MHGIHNWKLLLHFISINHIFRYIAGWRIAFHVVAIISSISHESLHGDDAKDLIKEAKDVMKMRSFQIFIAQGIAGSFPWRALSFVAMWFELIGFSHKYTAFLMTLFNIATAIGALFGGKMADFLAKHFPDAGRIILSQISAGSAIPLSAILLLGLKDEPSTGVSHAIAIFVMGLFMSWNSSGTNGPIFAEIVQEKSRTSRAGQVLRINTFIFRSSAVGILAENIYGYKLGDNNKSDDPKINRENTTSLAKATRLFLFQC
ncbi:hypothetical protein LUZ60_003028 [Juncus effusus]|nr:hypothetical protein LUZ60_003028 [Juncus effusus]